MSSIALQGLATAHRAAGDQTRAKQYAEQASMRIAAVPRVAENRAETDPDLVKANEVLDFVTRSQPRSSYAINSFVSTVTARKSQIKITCG